MRPYRRLLLRVVHVVPRSRRVPLGFSFCLVSLFVVPFVVVVVVAVSLYVLLLPQPGLAQARLSHPREVGVAAASGSNGPEEFSLW